MRRRRYGPPLQFELKWTYHAQTTGFAEIQGSERVAGPTPLWELRGRVRGRNNRSPGAMKRAIHVTGRFRWTSPFSECVIREQPGPTRALHSSIAAGNRMSISGLQLTYRWTRNVKA